MPRHERLLGLARFDEPRYLAAQLALIHRNMPVAMLAAVLVTLLFAGMHYRLAGDGRVWWWALAAGGVCLAGLALHLRRPQAEAGPRQATPPSDRQIMAHGHAFFVLALLIGLLWGSFAWWFMRTPQPLTTNLVLGALAGVNSAGMVLFSPVLPLSAVFLLTSVPPAAVVMLMSTSPADQVLGVAVLIYLAAMMGFCYQAARAVPESIDLRFVNAGLVARLRDQTQRAFDARQVAEDALLEAEAANHAKGVFLAAASHDLRQPLHALGLFVHTLRATALSPRQRGLLDQVDASAEAARDMLSTLLDFSKVDAGVVAPRQQPFALQTLLQRLGQEFAPEAAQRGLSYRAHPTPAVTLADPALVERILRNLIGNALRYTERGGVLVGCRLRGERVVVEVWDTGVGIPRHQQQAIFQEFHQLGNAERDRRKGLGLGLAIVEGLARAMSVSVSVSSVPGRGSVFRLTLPLSREVVVPAEAAVPLQADLSGARVLVIDDDDTVCAAMAELLTTWGVWCEVAGSAAEALALMARFTPQVVVADYRLRGQANGHEAIEQVRAQARRAIPGVLITGDTAADRLREAQATGAVLLHKPVPAAQLHAVLADLLSVARLADEAERVAQAVQRAGGVAAGGRA